MEVNSSMTIKFNIKEIRKNKKMTLKNVADRSGVSDTQINDIENNIKMPSLNTAVAIAYALKVKITELYTIIYWHIYEYNLK